MKRDLHTDLNVFLNDFYTLQILSPKTDPTHHRKPAFLHFWVQIFLVLPSHTHTYTYIQYIHTHTKKLYICLSSSSHNRQRLSSYYFSWTHEHFPEVSLFPVYRTDSNDEVLQENKLFITYIWIWVFYELIMHKSLFSVPQLLLINYC